MQRLQRTVRKEAARLTATGDLLDALAFFDELAVWLDGVRSDFAISAYQEGFTWDEIGEALNMTKQSARERFLLPIRSPRSGKPSPD